MLKSLLIENYALIDKLNIDFDAGFSTITGETGAGKSIMLGALALVLGQRAESKVIRNEEKKCVIEAVFNISNYDLKLFFEENELDYDENCIIRREITTAGKSRSFINDTPINVAILKILSNLLIDVHSQHENLLISNKSFQFNIIDTVARTQPLLSNLRLKLQEYKSVETEIKQLSEKAEKEQADVDYYQFLFNQLQEANLQENEQRDLETEQEILTNAEEIKSALTKANWLLSDDDKGLLPSLKEAVKTVGNVSAVLPKIEEINNRMDSCFIELKDLASDLEVIQNDLEVNQERLDAVTARLSLIYDLEQKHKVKSVKELLDIEQQLKERLENITLFDERIEALVQKSKVIYTELMQQAKELSVKRKEVTAQIEHIVGKQLSTLGMPNVQFLVSISENETVNNNGINEVEFLFSANKNIPPQSITKIASGGEVSRVMLCIKALLSDKIDVPTIIFDEIDTGVSGDIADKMGNIMKQMGNKIQVISITHLPQIAAKGNTQYKVFKSEKDISTETQIKKLTEKERIMEIAQMLSGSELTEAAIKNAESLLNCEQNR